MSRAPEIFRFRSAPTAPSPQSVDADTGVIRGVSAMQAVEALGHGMLIDATTLDQVAALGNAAAGKGIKVRFGHPGACDNALGTLVGHATNFRVAGDKVLHDITLSESASVSPKGNLRAYLLKLAAENPRDFGMSVVIKAKRAWKLSAGGEAISDKRPDNAVGDLPFARVTELKAVDFVDEPAANRDGLFSDADLVAAFSGTTNDDAENAFAAIDDVRDRLGLSAQDVVAFAQRYAAARTTPTTGTDMKLSAANLAALKSEFAEHAGLIIDLAVADKDESEIRSAIRDSKMSALDTKVADLSSKLTAAEAALAAEKSDHGKTKAKLATVEKLGANGSDPGSDASAFDTDEEKLRAAFASNKELNANFGGNFKAYLRHVKSQPKA